MSMTHIQAQFTMNQRNENISQGYLNFYLYRNAIKAKDSVKA